MPTALVTGATSGIGTAIALALASAGYEVTAVGRNRDALAQIGAQPFITGLCLDLTDRGRLHSAISGLDVDVLVNNAGIMPPLQNFCEAKLEDIDAAFAVNVTSAIELTRLVAPKMRRRGDGHIFFTGSIAGHSPFRNLAVYCATKAAIGGFAQALRLDLAESGIRVTEIVAGRVETGLYNAIVSREAREAMYAGGTAVQPRDVGAMVLAILGLPSSVDVSRFDILPVRQPTATEVSRKG